MMDGSLLLESLDSLWFFSNVLSSTKSTKELDPPEPISPIVQNQQNYDPPKAEFVKPRCDEFAAEEIEQHIVQPSITIEDHRVSKTVVKKEERERKRKSRMKRRISKRKIMAEINCLGLDGNCHYKDYGLFGVFGNENTWEHGMFGSQPQHHHHHHYHHHHHHHRHRLIKMPPLNDGMAMKEHLKSWAYAVACTVR